MNDNKLTFKEICTNKQYRSIFSLIIYFIIFVILIIIVRVGGTKPSNEINDKKEKVLMTEFESIKNKNFSFNYVMTIDNNKYEYVGKQNGEDVQFKYNNENYYITDDVFLKEKNDDYVLTDEVYLYFNYFDVDLLEKLLVKSTLNDGNYVLKYNDFNKIIMNNEKKYVPCELASKDIKDVVIEVERHNNIITGLKMDLSNVLACNNKNINLSLNYKDFNVIDKIDIK